MAKVIEWSYENVFKRNGYAPKKLPAEPLEVLKVKRLNAKEYEQLTESIKTRIRESKLKWLDECTILRHNNQTHRDWIIRMIKYFTFKEDKTVVERLTERLDKFVGLC